MKTLNAHMSVNSMRSRSPASDFASVFEGLAVREKRVLELIARGENTKQIAAKLQIAVSTARTYRARILAKFNRHEIISIVAEACSRGLIRPQG